MPTSLEYTSLRELSIRRDTYSIRVSYDAWKCTGTEELQKYVFLRIDSNCPFEYHTDRSAEMCVVTTRP